jgi:hypothetical protein
MKPEHLREYPVLQDTLDQSRNFYKKSASSSNITSPFPRNLMVIIKYLRTCGTRKRICFSLEVRSE